jgi:hypothetical protein
VIHVTEGETVTAGDIIELVAEEAVCAGGVDAEVDQEFGGCQGNEKEEIQSLGIRPGDVDDARRALV